MSAKPAKASVVKAVPGEAVERRDEPEAPAEGQCACGGTFEAATLKEPRLKRWLGLPFVLEQVEGLRCGGCGEETLPPAKVEAIGHVAAATVIGFEERLLQELTVFLRKYLKLTQKELAHRMGVTRKAVNEWENKREIAPASDYVLRGLVYEQLRCHMPASDRLFPDGIRPIFGRVHTGKPKRGRKKTILASHLVELAASSK